MTPSDKINNQPKNFTLQPLTTQIGGSDSARKEYIKNPAGGSKEISENKNATTDFKFDAGILSAGDFRNANDLPVLQEKLDTTTKTVTEYTQNVADSTKAVDGSTKAVDGFENEIKGYVRELGDLGYKGGQLGTEKTRIENELSGLKGDEPNYGSLKSELEEINRQIEVNDRAIEGLEGKKNTASDNKAEASKELEKNKTGLENNKAILDAAKENQERLQGQIEKLKGQVETDGKDDKKATPKTGDKTDPGANPASGAKPAGEPDSKAKQEGGTADKDDKSPFVKIRDTVVNFFGGSNGKPAGEANGTGASNANSGKGMAADWGNVEKKLYNKIKLNKDDMGLIPLDVKNDIKNGKEEVEINGKKYKTADIKDLMPQE